MSKMILVLQLYFIVFKPQKRYTRMVHLVHISAACARTV